MRSTTVRRARLRIAAMMLTFVALAGAAAFLVVDAVQACGPYLSLRPYLTRSFWLPMYYSMKLFLPSGYPRNITPYAGFANETIPAELAELRAAYSPLARTTPPGAPQAYEDARRVAARALAPGVLTGKALEEARLIECKLALRLAEWDHAQLAEARRKLEEFIASAQNPAFASEARGWLGRVFYLQKEYVRAVLIYLDEGEAADSPLSRDTLLTSLRWAYTAGQTQIWDRAEEFFDTPRHALFLVSLATNDTRSYSGDGGYKRIEKERGEKVLALLQKHPALFKAGADADALVLSLMRTSIYMGDLAATGKYAAASAKSSALHQNPEFNWMEAIAHFTSHDFAGAEGPLRRMLDAPSASADDRATAAQALVGVYLKTGRKVDALHAALIQKSQSAASQSSPDVVYPRMQFCIYCLDLGLPYLLDIGLSEAELRAYLTKYPEPVGLDIRVFGWEHPGTLTSTQIVRYSLAVRLARREEYAEAGKIFTELGSGERAGHMQALAGLLARSKDPALPASERLQALYDYGSYLAAHPDHIYFNDLLWQRMQIYVFLENYMAQFGSGDPHGQPGLTRRERETILADDRRLRDEQEERWKAFHVLEQVAREAGHTELGRKAALKIVECLGAINTGRFGRGQEISKSIATWQQWLNSR